MGLQCHAPEGTRHGTLPANSDRRAGWGGTSSHASKNFFFVRLKKNCSAFLERSDSSILATIATGIFGLDLPKTWPTGSVESEGGRPGEDIAGGRADCDRGVTR